MRGLSSRNVRPSLAQKHLLHTCTPVRRTFLLPNKRRFNAADAFSILLAPILTTAFIVDTTAKQDKSREWDRQIAAVEAQTEQLREEQIQAWSRLQKRSISNGVRQQRRMYTTVVQAAESQDEMEDPMNHDVSKQDPDSEGGEMLPDAGLSEEDLKAVYRFDRLIATRLALQLLLQLKSGNDRMYSLPIHDQPHAHFAENHHSLDYILNELGKVGRMLHNLYLRKLPYGITHSPEYLEKRERLSHDLTNLTERYRRSDIHLPEFVMSYMNIIAKYQMGPPVTNYVQIMRVFQKMGIMSMAVFAESAVWEAQQYLDNKAVSSILYCHGTEMDAYRLKEFLKRMTRTDLFPRPQVTWRELYIQDIRLAVPTTHNPWVMASLIRASLCCQQFTIAEAYAQEFIRRDGYSKYEGRFKCWLITCFLSSYGRLASWKYGSKWINQAIAWMVDMLQDGRHLGENLLGRCILRIMEYCVVCGREDVYESLLQATIICGIPCPPVDTTKAILMSNRMTEIRLDWSTQMYKHGRRRGTSEQNGLQEAITYEDLAIFQQTLRNLLKLPHRTSRFPTYDIEAEDSPSTEDYLQLTGTRLKSLHQSAGVRTTTKPLSPLLAKEGDTTQPEEYVFSPWVTSRSEEGTSQPRLNPKTSLITAASKTNGKPTLETLSQPSLTPNLTSHSALESDNMTETSSTEKPLQSRMTSYSDFWPNMTIDGTQQGQVVDAGDQHEQYQDPPLRRVAFTQKTNQSQSKQNGQNIVQQKKDDMISAKPSKRQSAPKSKVEDDEIDFLTKRMVTSVG